MLNDILLLRPTKVAEVLDISRSNVYVLLRNGTLPAIRLGGRFRVRVADLEAWVKEHPLVEEPATWHGRRRTG